MRVLLVGSNKIFAIENFYAKYLTELGVIVFHFSAQSFFFDYYYKNIFNKLIFKAGLSSVYKKINKEFKVTVESFKPDCIWVFKGMEISVNSLQWAKKKGIKLINYNPDSPFVFSGKGSGNKNILQCLPHYHLYLTYDSSIRKKIEQEVHIPSAILPFGFDVSEELYSCCCAQNEIHKVCFLGNPDIYRASFILELAGRGIEIDVYGNNWSRFAKHDKIQVFQPVYSTDFWLVLRRYRVQLNLMRPHNPESHNMRSFEVPGIGGIQLAPKTKDHENHFESGKEIFLFSDIEECYHQLIKLLGLSDDEANKIRQDARNRSLNSGYSYRERAKQALMEINKI